MSERAERIRKNTTFEVEVEASGNRYVLRKGEPGELVKLGMEIPVPTELATNAAPMPEGQEGIAITSAKPEAIADRESEQGLRQAQAFAKHFIVDPPVEFVSHPTEPSEGAVAYWMIFPDIAALINAWAEYCGGKTGAKVIPFRPDRDGTHGASGSEDVRPGATRAAGTDA